MQIVVNQLLTSYDKKGNGKKVILFLHGWADVSGTFDSLARVVLKDSSKYTIVTLDLPGFGGTQAPAEAWNLSDYAVFVAEFLKKTKINTTVITGHSNGGAIAVKGIADGTLEADKLVLIASAGIREPSLKKAAMRLIAKPAGLAIRTAPRATQKKIRRKLYSAIGSDYLVAEHMQDTFKQVVSTDIREDAARVSIPVCLIYGEADTATPPTYGKLLAEKLRNSNHHEIPLAGHFVHQEQAIKVAAIMDSFLSS